MKNKEMPKLFFVSFLVGFIFLGISIIPTQGNDTYCTMFVGYIDTAIHFLESGRIFTALAFWIYSILKININILGITSIILTNIFLSLSTIAVYKKIKEIYNYIDKYEKDNNTIVKNIYYHNDTNVSSYYDIGGNNLDTVRFMYSYWSFKCGLGAYTNKNYNYKEMTEEEYIKYFNNVNYDEFNEKELIFDKDSLYILLY